MGNQQPINNDILLSYDYELNISCSEDEEQAEDLKDLELNPELASSMEALAMYYHARAEHYRSK